MKEHLSEVLFRKRVYTHKHLLICISELIRWIKKGDLGEKQKFKRKRSEEDGNRILEELPLQ